MKRKIYWAFAFVVCGTAAVIAGNRYFVKNIQPDLLKPITRLDFQLLDVDGAVFDSAKRREAAGGQGQPLVIFYLPDDISIETQQAYSAAVRAYGNQRVKTKELIFVSRLDLDNLRNMQRLSGFKGPFLNDPSGSLLQKMRKWNPEGKSREWTSIELGKDGSIIRLRSGGSPELSWID